MGACVLGWGRGDSRPPSLPRRRRRTSCRALGRGGPASGVAPAPERSEAAPGAGLLGAGTPTGEAASGPRASKPSAVGPSGPPVRGGPRGRLGPGPREGRGRGGARRAGRGGRVGAGRRAPPRAGGEEPAGALARGAGRRRRRPVRPAPAPLAAPCRQPGSAGPRRSPRSRSWCWGRPWVRAGGAGRGGRPRRAAPGAPGRSRRSLGVSGSVGGEARGRRGRTGGPDPGGRGRGVQAQGPGWSSGQWSGAGAARDPARRPLGTSAAARSSGWRGLPVVPGPEWLLASGLQLRVLHLLLRDLLPAVLLPGPEPAHHREAAEALPGLQVGAGPPLPPSALSAHTLPGPEAGLELQEGPPATVMWSSRAGPGPPSPRACAGRGQGQPQAQRRSGLWPDW